MTWVFAEFELDEELFELRRAGTTVRLQRKPLKLLLHLAQNASRVVPSEELVRTVWPGVVVAEASLRQAVRALRRALGDENGEHVINVRGYGYRLRIPEQPTLLVITGRSPRDHTPSIGNVLTSVSAAIAVQ